MTVNVTKLFKQFYERCNFNYLSLNSNKCQVFSNTNKINQLTLSSYRTTNTEIFLPSLLKYIGILLDSKLLFVQKNNSFVHENQLDTIQNKAYPINLKIKLLDKSNIYK